MSRTIWLALFQCIYFQKVTHSTLPSTLTPSIYPHLLITSTYFITTPHLHTQHIALDMDRSAEFFATVESLRSRAQPHLPSDKRRLLSPIEQQAASQGQGPAKQKSEFAMMASLIGKDIHATAGKLQKLARRTLLRLLTEGPAPHHL